MAPSAGLGAGLRAGVALGARGRRPVRPVADLAPLRSTGHPSRRGARGEGRRSHEVPSLRGVLPIGVHRSKVPLSGLAI
eukprot:1956083-Alexandrium_andersonii.AAC.1